MAASKDTAREHSTSGGNTLPRQEGRSVPRLPHEHDQSADQQDGDSANASETGRQAYADRQKGLQDTDRGPVLDKIYNEKVGRGAEGVGEAPKRQGRA